MYDRAFLGFIIHADDAKTLGTTLPQFKVIEQRPDHVSPHFHDVQHSEADLGEVLFQVIAATRTVDFFIRADFVLECRAVYGDVNREHFVFALYFHNHPAQGRRGNFLARLGVFI